MAQTGATNGRFEILHQLVGAEWGGAAMDALVDGFEREYPNYSIEETTSAADNLSIRVKIRILQRRAPDAWMEWPGRNVEPYVEAGVVRDISHVWEEYGLEDAFVDSATEQVRFDGDFCAVPLNIHRINNLFFNVSDIERAGVDLAANSPREFLEVLEQLDDALSMPPFVMALRNPWGAVHVWETILLGETDARTYQSIVDGAATANSGVIESTLELLGEYVELANDDALFCSLPGANAHFVADEGATFLMGDWAASAYDQNAYGQEWDAIPFPGTDGLYPMNMDALIPAETDENTDPIDAFLGYAGSREAQTAFNRHKGSTPPRTDTDVREFTPFLQDQHEDFTAASALPPSIAHGLAVGPEQFIELKSAMAEFVSDTDVTAATERIVDALDASDVTDDIAAVR